MKRSAIKIKIKHMIAFCKKWAVDHLEDLNTKVYSDKSLSEYEANERICMALEFQELCEDLLEKDCTWKELRTYVKQLPDKRDIKQGSLFTNNKIIQL